MNLSHLTKLWEILIVFHGLCCLPSEYQKEAANMSSNLFTILLDESHPVHKKVRLRGEIDGMEKQGIIIR